MQRRTALAMIGSGVTSLLAGCSFERERVGREPETVGSRPATPSSTTERTEQSTTESRLVGDVPEDRILGHSAVSEDGIGVTADRWFGLEAVRYSDGDEYQTVSTEDGWFVAYEFTIENRGESAVGSVPDSVFDLGIDGESYEHIHEFPGGVQFDKLDQPSSEPQIRPLEWYSTLQPGEAVSLQLVYEAPVRLDYRHYLVWEPGSPVDEATEPVYLTGRRALADREQ